MFISSFYLGFSNIGGDQTANHATTIAYPAGSLAYWSKFPGTARSAPATSQAATETSLSGKKSRPHFRRIGKIRRPRSALRFSNCVLMSKGWSRSIRQSHRNNTISWIKNKCLSSSGAISPQIWIRDTCFQSIIKLPSLA